MKLLWAIVSPQPWNNSFMGKVGKLPYRSRVGRMVRRSRKQIVLKDPRAIRALTHPARIVVIDELYGGRVATSTELAELTGLTPSAMSYHLRAMEKHGLVERDDSSTDGRERPWRAAGNGLSVTSLTTTAQRTAATLLTGAVLETQRRELEAYTAAEPTMPPEWRGRTNFDSGTVYLTPEETKDLLQALQAAAEPYRNRGPRRRKGTRRVRVTFSVIPSASD